jgi:hypothetical protein
VEIKKEFSLRALVSYLLALTIACILTEVVWGVAGGLVGGISIARDLQYQQKISAFMQERGVDIKADSATLKKAFDNLSAQDQLKLKEMTGEVLNRINWLPTTFAVSAFVFSLVGFLGGFISGVWLAAGFVPALTFIANNPVVRFQAAGDLSLMEKALVVVLAQFAACYLAAYYGSKVRLKRDEKKRNSVK